MLSRVSAIEFVRPMDNGRTCPSLVVCQDGDDDGIEVVLKCTAGCERKEGGLASEVISACLAADLGLPVMRPYLVEIDPEFIAAVTDAKHRARLGASNPVAFGSALATRQFSAWSSGNRVANLMLEPAAAIFAFDGIIQNSDRRSGNPNCLVRGDDVRIIDHELAFAHHMIISWRAPWLLGGLQSLERPGAHIFRADLLGKELDYRVIRAAWAGLSDEQIAGYGVAVPAEWSSAQNDVARALKLIQDARDNIDACIVEIKRVLK